MKLAARVLFGVSLAALAFLALQWWGSGWEDDGPDAWVRVSPAEPATYSVVSPANRSASVGLVSDDEALDDPASWKPISSTARISLEQRFPGSDASTYCATRRRLIVRGTAPPAGADAVVAVFDTDTCLGDTESIMTIDRDGNIVTAPVRHGSGIDAQTVARALVVLGVVGGVATLALGRRRTGPRQAW